MSQPGKKRQTTSHIKGNEKKARHEVPSDDSPVVVVKNKVEDAKSISLSPDLNELLHPMTEQEFLDQHFRQKAVHITCDQVGTDNYALKRVSDLREAMFDLDPEMIIRETSSDNVFLWLVDKGGNKEIQDRKSSTIRSIEISDVDTAISLHKIAKHATYCRAPPMVEQNLVASLLKATGLGCGQYDPSGESIISMGRGEVETFISTENHLTNWHYDFQENFTIQLSGTKRWTLQQGTIKDPIRGCTPHYASPEAVESQLKAAHLFDRKFRFGFPEKDVTAVGNVHSIDVKPGDVFYFPAGMWHKVDTIEPGVSINVSLMASNYASIASQALHQLMFQDERWRQPVLNNKRVEAVDHLKALLKELPSMIQRLEQSGGAEAILPPVLRHPPSFLPTGDEGGEWEDFENEEKDCGPDGGKETAGDDGSETAKSVGDREEDNLLDPTKFDSFPENWSYNLELGETVQISRNPLAALHKLTETTSFYDNNDDDDDNDDGKDIFILNVNYAGNETHQSAIRVVFRDNDDSFVQSLYCNERQNGDVTKTIKVSEKNESHLKFLVFHGYLQILDSSSRSDMPGKANATKIV
ncbi:unnamed protein product [Cylindrotheca closterium]|uniref:JmjC domain-containing protein n=1 Tax=Cylindrotheca closterium TaxID=2856 RepID=A0AAD2CGL5_9STRA|nr:unnamed protein product [Cylindrotheca closterium]